MQAERLKHELRCKAGQQTQAGPRLILTWVPQTTFQLFDGHVIQPKALSFLPHLSGGPVSVWTVGHLGSKYVGVFSNGKCWIIWFCLASRQHASYRKSFMPQQTVVQSPGGPLGSGAVPPPETTVLTVLTPCLHRHYYPSCFNTNPTQRTEKDLLSHQF